MKNNIYDGANLNPVNKTASKVIKKGVHFNEKVRDETLSYEPIPIRPKWFKRSFKHQKFVESVIGVRRGRLVVVGESLVQKGKSKRGNLFVVRCDCGSYSVRRISSFLKLDSFGCCDNCLQLLELKVKDYYLRTGKQLTVKDFF